MNKKEILDSIRRIAAANNGKAPGSQRFTSETGVRKHDWYPHLWLKWGDAVVEAGFEPNALSVAPPDEILIHRHIEIIRELGRFPIEGDLRLNPSRRGISSLGNKRARVEKVLAYCRLHNQYADIVPICEAVLAARPSPAERLPAISALGVGYVYLLKHGSRSEYKIGRTINPIRREGEVRLEPPEKVQPVHTIKTDDPAGVESYWHKRFADRRIQGEWFTLTLDDVRAFKRWKRIS